MIFGKRSALAFEIEPREPAWDRRGIADRGPWANLRIWCEDQRLTWAVLPDSDRVIHGVDVPLVPLANWLVEHIREIAHEEFPAAFRAEGTPHEILREWNNSNPPLGGSADRFDDDRYEWYARHFWMAGAEGCLVPDLAFVCVDGRLLVSWEQPRFSGPRQVRFMEPSGCAAVDWREGFDALASFSAYVAEQLRSRGLRELPWASDKRPLKTAARCTVAEYLQLVAPGMVNPESPAGVTPGDTPGADPLLQSLRDLHLDDDSAADIEEAFRRLTEEKGTNGSDLERLENMRAMLHAARNAGTPEQAGYDAARKVRRELGLNGEPIKRAKLESLVGEYATLSPFDADDQRNNFAVTLHADGSARLAFFDHARTRRPWARRMELARALAHLFLDARTEDGVLGAGSSVRAIGPRRRRSGAFAAELLLPISEVREIVAGRQASAPAVFEEIMDTFEVGARTAAYHLWNHHVITCAEERDALIDGLSRRDTANREP